MKKLKSLLILFLLVLSPAILTPTVGASNDAGSEACAGLESLGVDCNADGKTAEEVAQQPLRSLINTLSIVIGAIAVIMIIYGGFKFITSGGDADGTKAARNTIIYAVVGLLVVLLAQTIVYFVFSKSKDLQNTSATPTSVRIIDNRGVAAIS